MYSDMSKRRNSTPITLASWRATSVLPTPVGPANRKAPTGRSGCARPERASLIARAHRLDRRVLPKDHLLEFGLEILQARPIGGGHRALRNLRHPRHRALGVARAHRHRLGAVRAQMCRDTRLVHHVDRLVGQVAVVDVARGQIDRGANRRRRVAHVVMLLVVALESVENLYRLFRGRLGHVDTLEAPRPTPCRDRTTACIPGKSSIRYSATRPRRARA